MGLVREVYRESQGSAGARNIVAIIAGITARWSDFLEA